MNICLQCANYNSSTKICGKCWCFMPMKVKLAPACCPEHKWLHHTIEHNYSTNSMVFVASNILAEKIG